ncbi:hypothetical protein AGMMS49982_04510 [Bacteroidia bacterium]|nr:hypothetical protein AGMMS49982_04510 [Bacteroidia bacterium]
METRTLRETLVSNENLLEEVKKVRSPEQIGFLYDIIVLMRNKILDIHIGALQRWVVMSYELQLIALKKQKTKKNSQLITHNS